MERVADIKIFLDHWTNQCRNSTYEYITTNYKDCEFNVKFAYPFTRIVRPQ